MHEAVPGGRFVAEGDGRGGLEDGAREHHSGRVLFGEMAERGFEAGVILGEDRLGAFEEEDDGGVDGVLAGGPEVNVAGGGFVDFADAFGEGVDEWDSRRRGVAGGTGDGGGIERDTVHGLGDGCGCGGGDEAEAGLRAGECGFEGE